MIESTDNYLKAPLSSTAESFGLVSSSVNWQDGKLILSIATDSGQLERPFANDFDLQRLEADLARATHYVKIYPYNSLILFNDRGVLGLYRQKHDNPTYEALVQRLPVSTWYSQYSHFNEVNGVKVAAYTIYQHINSFAYDNVMLDGVMYNQHSAEGQATIRQFANHLRKSDQWRLEQPLVIDNPKPLSWLVALNNQTSDRLIVANGVVRQNVISFDLVDGYSYPFTARMLIHELSARHLIDWLKLQDVTITGLAHYVSLDKDTGQSLADLQVDVDCIDTLMTITLTKKEE